MQWRFDFGAPFLSSISPAISQPISASDLSAQGRGSDSRRDSEKSARWDSAGHDGRPSWRCSAARGRDAARGARARRRRQRGGEPRRRGARAGRRDAPQRVRARLWSAERPGPRPRPPADTVAAARRPARRARARGASLPPPDGPRGAGPRSVCAPACVRARTRPHGHAQATCARMRTLRTRGARTAREAHWYLVPRHCFLAGFARARRPCADSRTARAGTRRTRRKWAEAASRTTACPRTTRCTRWAGAPARARAGERACFSCSARAPRERACVRVRIAALTAGLRPLHAQVAPPGHDGARGGEPAGHDGDGERRGAACTGREGCCLHAVGLRWPAG